MIGTQPRMVLLTDCVMDPMDHQVILTRVLPHMVIRGQPLVTLTRHPTLRRMAMTHMQRSVPPSPSPTRLLHTIHRNRLLMQPRNIQEATILVTILKPQRSISTGITVSWQVDLGTHTRRRSTLLHITRLVRSTTMGMRCITRIRLATAQATMLQDWVGPGLHLPLDQQHPMAGGEISTLPKRNAHVFAAEDSWRIWYHLCTSQP